MKRGLRILELAAVCAVGALLPAAAQGPDTSLERLESLAAVLDRETPGFSENPAREQAFLGLDQYFEAAVRPGQPFDLSQMPNSLCQWIDRRLLRTLNEAEAPPKDPDELAIWQMYNMGLLCRSGKAVIGLDLADVLDLTPEFCRRVAALVDVLLVTHAHNDHYDANLVQACLDAGKPVFVPAAIAAERESHPRLHAIAESGEFDVAGVKITARRGVHVWAGSRDDIHIVYYEVMFPTGRTVIFCGDLDYTREFEKTPGRAVDLLVIPWRSPSKQFESGSPLQAAECKPAVQLALDRVQPRFLLYGHYAELGHVHGGVPASYNLAAGLKRAVATPSEVLFWGESLRLPPAPRR